MRLALLTLFIAIAFAPEARAACDLDAIKRPTDAARYVALAEGCLAEPPGDGQFEAAIETAFFERINAERRDAGLPELDWRPASVAVARFHSLDMAANRYFSHVGIDGRTMSDRISLLDRSLLSSRRGENLAMLEGQLSPEALVDELHKGLMLSEGHRANIMGTEWTHMAIGVARVGNRVLVTQLFIKVDGEIIPPLPPEVAAGERVYFSVRLGDWTPRETIWTFGKDRVTTSLNASGTIAPETLSEAIIYVSGTQAGETERTLRMLEFFGPQVTVSAASEE